MRSSKRCSDSSRDWNHSVAMSAAKARPDTTPLSTPNESPISDQRFQTSGPSSRSTSATAATPAITSRVSSTIPAPRASRPSSTHLRSDGDPGSLAT